ncbi:IS1 family transposase [Microcoleus sp. FACHB-1515]|uniref:IS1/IS1595 family N-terminal zinc-binding domain-containing protein n=1 Tax=Microcoleus sp. FACHB-1515 TaxID=2692821 RepID=UPI0037CA358B
MLPSCPTCPSAQTVKKGRIHTGKQRFKCRECGRQFVEDPANAPIAQSMQVARLIITST